MLNAVTRAGILISGMWLAGSALADGAPPTLPLLDYDALDRSADPCVNFYQFACGGWHKSNPRPENARFWSRPFTQFSRRVDAYVVDLIHSARDATTQDRSDLQTIGSYYAACMDTEAIEGQGLEPLRLELSIIDSVRTVADLPAALGALHSLLPWYPSAGEPLFWISAIEHYDDSGAIVVPRIGPAGLGLPGPDYYSEQTDAQLADYVNHVAKMLAFIGTDTQEAVAQARAILALEAKLAAGYLPKDVSRNNPVATHNPMSIEKLGSITPNFDWQSYFRTHGIPESSIINVREPRYLEVLDQALAETPPATLRAYLRWLLLAERSNHLPERFREARFEFFGKRLAGQTQPRPRSQLCVDALKSDLPSPLGRVFVANAFDPESRTVAEAIFEEVRVVLSERVRTADWLAPGTREEALRKIQASRMSLGHPDNWLDDKLLTIRKDDHYGNVKRSGHALRRVGFDRLGRAPSLDWWGEPVIWMGGYYQTRMNRMVITAAMMLNLNETQGDPALLYGGLGAFIAHELIHGFDPTGSRFDSRGRQRNWWTDEDHKQFRSRSQCVADHYSSLEYAPGIPIDGNFVVSEQFTELASTAVAWDMFHRSNPGKTRIGDLTPQQRMLTTIGQTWCADASEGGWKQLAAGGSAKAWAKPMVNGTMMLFPPFADAFECRADEPMVLPADEICETW